MSIQTRKCVFFSVMGPVVGFGHCKSSPMAPEPLNIVLIVGDDIGRNDLGCYGNDAVQTSNIDRLAKEGIRFTNAYLATSQYSPSRCSIISERYPHNTGAAELHTPLPPSIQTFPELLKKVGYYAAQAGKWHMGEHAKRAFNVVYDHGKAKNGDGGERMWVDVLKERPKHKPFFMWFAWFDAHRTWGPTTRVLGTSFFVDAPANAAKIGVKVVTGKVSVFPLDHSKQAPPSDSAKNSTANGVVLSPNQKVAYCIDGGHWITRLIEDPIPVKSLNVETLSFVFSNTPIPDVLGDINERFAIEVMTENENILKCIFTGDVSRIRLYDMLDVSVMQ